MLTKKCYKCGKCCRTKMGPFVFPDDVPIICDYLSIKPIDFLNEYCIKHAFTYDKNTVDLYSIKSIDNKCMFLDDKLCSIYNARPFQCRNAPYNFLGYYEFWKHMPCVTPDDFSKIDTSQSDKKRFKSLVETKYDRFFKEE